MSDEQDPLVARVVPEYQGETSPELEAEFESRFSGSQTESGASDDDLDS